MKTTRVTPKHNEMLQESKGKQDKEPETKTVLTYKTEYCTVRKIQVSETLYMLVQFIMGKARGTKPNQVTIRACYDKEPETKQ